LLFSLFIILFHSLLNPANETLWGRLGWEGFIYGSIVALRLTGIVALAQLFLMTTLPQEIFRLFSSWHRDLGLIMLLLLDLLPVLLEEMEITAQAQQTRGLSWNNLVSKIRAYLAMIIPVVIKSLNRAHGMAYLLYLRGYGEDVQKQPAGDTFLPIRAKKGYRWLAAVSVSFFIVNLALLIQYRLL
jgi:energy-coupling factor transport system permease protein